MDDKCINSKIKSNIGFYPIDQVNCFSRAFGICLNSFDQSLSNLFYMVNNYDKCYHINGISESKELFAREINTFELVCDLRVSKAYSKDDLFSLLEEHISMNNPVIVPVNLREIYYSDYYQESDWEHPIIIKGFDRPKKIFYILDHTQIKSDDQQELEFSIEYETLFKAYKSYFDNIAVDEEEFILIFEKRSNEPLVISRLLDHCLRIIFENEASSVEIKKLANKVNLNKRVLNMPKYKELFFSIMINEMSHFGYLMQNDVELLTNNKLKLIDKWRTYILKSYKNRLKGESYFCEKELEEIRSLENQIWQQLKLRYLDNFGQASILNVSQTTTIENNEDNIITQQEKNIYFTFDGNKIYNTWLGDDSPKIMFKKSSKVDFKINVKVIENKEFSDFAAGIVIRIKDDVYYFALDSGRRINLDRKGKEGSINENIIQTNEVELMIHFSESNCQFLYNCEGKVESLCILDLNANEIEYGIGCKTYFYPRPLIVEMKVL